MLLLLYNGVINSVLTLLFLVFVWYLRYYRKRHHLYYCASKFPGPRTLPFLGNALYFVRSNKDVLYNTLLVARLYDSPVRLWLGPKLFICLSTAEDLEIAFNSPHALEKDDLYKYLKPIIGTGLSTAPVPKWKRHRKIIMPMFKQSFLNHYVPVFVEQANVLTKQLEKEIGKGSFNIFHYVSRCSLDIICETAMGTTVKAQINDPDYIKFTTSAMEIMFRRMTNILYHFDFIFELTPYAKRFRENVAEMHNFTGSVVKEQRELYQNQLKYEEAEAPTRKSFLRQLIEMTEDGGKFTDEDLRNEVDTFMVAGTDIVASTISFTLMILGMYPEIQEKMYQEVLDVLGPDRPMNQAHLNQFKYMERVIKETMRIFPAGSLLSRALTQDIQLTDKNLTIPADCTLLLNIYALHLDPKVWPDPFKFEPDRFLPEEVAKRHPYSFLPFSGGPRNCVGSKFAFMEMKVILSNVIRKYKFLSKYKKVEDVQLKLDLVLKPFDGHNVSIELRH